MGASFVVGLLSVGPSAGAHWDQDYPRGYAYVQTTETRTATAGHIIGSAVSWPVADIRINGCGEASPQSYFGLSPGEHKFALQDNWTSFDFSDHTSWVEVGVVACKPDGSAARPAAGPAIPTTATTMQLPLSTAFCARFAGQFRTERRGGSA